VSDDLELALRLVDAADAISLPRATGTGSSAPSTEHGSKGEARIDAGTARSSNGVLHDALLRSRAP
jgi:hypothetical protein